MDNSKLESLKRRRGNPIYDNKIIKCSVCGFDKNLQNYPHSFTMRTSLEKTKTSTISTIRRKITANYDLTWNYKNNDESIELKFMKSLTYKKSIEVKQDFINEVKNLEKYCEEIGTLISQNGYTFPAYPEDQPLFLKKELINLNLGNLPIHYCSNFHKGKENDKFYTFDDIDKELEKHKNDQQIPILVYDN